MIFYHNQFKAILKYELKRLSERYRDINLYVNQDKDKNAIIQNNYVINSKPAEFNDGEIYLEISKAFVHSFVLFDELMNKQDIKNDDLKLVYFNKQLSDITGGLFFMRCWSSRASLVSRNILNIDESIKKIKKVIPNFKLKNNTSVSEQENQISFIKNFVGDILNESRDITSQP